MGKLTAVLILTLVASVAACADTPTGAIAPVDVALSHTTVPTASGPVWVIGYFNLDIAVGGDSAGVNNHPQGKGSCVGTTWYNSQGQETNAKFCEGTEPGTESVACETDPIAATYAFGGAGAPADDANAGGNENLNFTGVEWGEQGVFVHFNSARDRYKRQGELTVDYTCQLDIDGVATIDLNATDSQFRHIDSTNRKLDPVEFDTGGATPVEGWLEWEYRSRNDIPQTTP